MPSAEELRIVRTVARGDWVHFPDIEAGGVKIPVRAELIRELLLGQHEGGTRTVARSVMFRGAVIEGSLGLRDCVGEGGSALPPLLLHDCQLLGTRENPLIPVLDASDSHLSRLSLNGCKLGVVDLSRADIAGDLELDDVDVLDDERSCQLVAPMCTVHGSVCMRGARLRIAKGQKTPRDGREDSAVYFRESDIHGSLLLQPGTRIEGGLSVSGARIRGNIWAEGIQIEASGDCAVSGQRLSCDGTVALREDSRGHDSRHPQTHGCVDLSWSSIGFVDLTGLIIQGDEQAEREGLPALDLLAATIRHSILLSGLKTHSCIRISSAVIGGDLFAADMKTCTAAQHYIQILAENASVAGNVNITDASISISAAGLRVDHNIVLERLISNQADNPGIIARNVFVGNDCQLTEVASAIDIELAQIHGNLTIKGAQVSSLSAVDAEVRGWVKLDGALGVRSGKEVMLFDGGKYGAFEIVNLRIDLSGSLTGAQKCVSVQDATIERDLQFGQISVALMREDGWAQKPPLKAESTELSFYPGTRLVEVLYELQSGEEAVGAFLLLPASRLVPLDGNSTPIHSTNVGLLALNDARAVEEYLRFFCAYVWGDEGAFRIVESTEHLVESTQAITPIKLERTSEGWLASACIVYGGQLFRASLKVLTDGTVEMTDDEPVSTTAEKRHFKFDRSVRIPASAAAKADPFWIRSIAGMGERVVEVPPEETLLDAVRAIERTRPVPAGSPNAFALVQLCGLKAASLNCRPDRSFLAHVLLDMDAFEYGRLEQPADTASEQFEAAGASGVQSSNAATQPVHGLRDQCLMLLRRRYETGKPSTPHEYSPQPYEQLARVLRAHGRYDESRAVMLEKLVVERPFLQTWWARLGAWVMETCFDHGLFAKKSLVVFFGFWLFGTMFFDFANQGCIGLPIGSLRHCCLRGIRLEHPVLVLDSTPVSFLAVNREGLAPATLLATSEKEVTTEIPCGDSIEPALYALDTMVPLLNLRQETKCAITSRDDAWPWRLIAGAYATSGAFVTSIMLLTVSGLLRRRAEQ